MGTVPSAWVREPHDGQPWTVRRKTIWTTPRSIGEEDRHEAMRQRQEARKQQREEEVGPDGHLAAPIDLDPAPPDWAVHQ